MEYLGIVILVIVVTFTTLVAIGDKHTKRMKDNYPKDAVPN